MSAEQRKVCHEWLVGLPSWNQIVVRGAGITASDAVKNVVMPEMERNRDGAIGGGGPAGADTPGLDEFLDEIEEPVIRHVRLAWAATDDGLDVARQSDLELTPLQIGGAVLRAIAKAIKENRQVTAEHLDAVVAARIRKAPPAGRRLSRDAFASAYAELFDERWEAVGEGNLRDFPHEIAGLGPDEKPPLVRYESEHRMLGTATSVHRRFKLAAQDGEVGGDADVVARAEIERACGRWGLLLEGTFVVMRSLYSGMTNAPEDDGHIHPRAGEFSTAWRNETGPLRESRAEHELAPTGEWVHGELAAYAQAETATFLRRQDCGRLLKREGRVHEAREDALKRGWYECLKVDRRDVEPDASQGSSIVNTAITKGILDGQRDRMKQRILAEPPAMSPPDPDVTAGSRDAALAYCAHIGRERTEDLLAGDPLENARYEEAAGDGSMLPLTELLRLAGRADDVPPETEEGGGDVR